MAKAKDIRIIITLACTECKIRKNQNNRKPITYSTTKNRRNTKYISILRLLDDGMSATMLSNSGTEAEPFTVETAVKQGCVTAPTQFAIDR